MMLEASVHLAVLRHGRGRLIHYHHVKTAELVLVVPERFSNHSFDPVSRARLATLFFRNSEPEPRDFVIVVTAEHCKEFVATARRFFKDAAKGGGVQQSVLFLKPKTLAARQS